MAQTYTLEEAAVRLGLPTDDFKRRLRDEWKSVRSFRDGPTMRFRAADIDELARVLGQASEPELTLAPPGADIEESSDEVLAPLKPPSSGRLNPASSGRLKAKAKRDDEPLQLAPDEDDTDDIFTVPVAESGSKSGKKKKGPQGDSDVRLDTTPPKVDPNGDFQTEELTLDLAPPASGILKAKSSGRLNAPSSGKLAPPPSGRIPGPKATPPADDGSGEYELKLEDSDSFELELDSDSSEEVDLGGPPPADRKGGQSGINLGRPADSGINLERRKAPKEDESDLDFDLTLDAPGASGSKLKGPPSGGRVMSTTSDSEFELSLEDSSSDMVPLVEGDSDEVAAGDIFETDFELPAAGGEESGSEVLALDSDTDLDDSDFEVAAIDEGDAPAAEDESASQVMLVDDEEPVELEGEDALLVDEGEFGLAEDEDSVAGALAGVHRGERGEVEVRTVAAPPAKWGIVPVLFLFPSFIAVLLGGLMTFEMVRGMWGYQQPIRTSDSLVRGVADTFGLKAND